MHQADQDERSTETGQAPNRPHSQLCT